MADKPDEMNNEHSKELLHNFASRFLNEFVKVKNEKFTGHPFGTFIRNDVPENFYKTKLVDRDKYLIKGSIGNGNWAGVPWVAIFDKDITTAATKGIYIVYLLSQDGNSLYLTFNQGCTNLMGNCGNKGAIRFMREKAKEIAAQIDSRGFNTDENINLGENVSSLGEMYQKGTIFYKEYKKGLVPEETELRNDLKNMMEIYKEYAAKKR